jgi:hypothetical protein
MKILSATLWTFLLLVAVSFFGNKLLLLDTLRRTDRIFTICAIGLTLFQAITGWTYAIANWKSIGLVHCIVMAGFAAWALYLGIPVLFATLTAPSGGGPGANHMGYVGLLAGGAACILGAITLFFACWLSWDVIRVQRPTDPAP